MTTTNVYVTNCALIRQELKDPRSAVLPPGYVSVQRSIIMNLFKTRAVLEETIKRLSLPYTAEQLFNNIEVKAERNSDYYFLSASSKDPTLAAALANTLADVFIEEYKKLIRKNLEDLNDSYVRTQNEFEKQLDDQNEKLKRVNAENNLTSIENDIAFNNQRLLQVEDQLTRAASTLESSKKAMYELQGELANTPEEVVTSRERSTVAEDELMRAETRLHEYEQLYAKNNPLLIQQRELVKKLKADIEKAREEENEADDINKRVVVAEKVKDLKAGDRSIDLYFNNIKSTLLRNKTAAAAEAYLASVADKVKAWAPADSAAVSAAVAANKIEKVNIEKVTASVDGYVPGFGYGSTRIAKILENAKEGEWSPAVATENGAVMVKVVSKKVPEEAAVKEAVKTEIANTSSYVAMTLFTEFVNNLENSTAVESNLDLYYRD